jgi:L-rhamnose isomerase
MLMAMLEPIEQMRTFEQSGDSTSRLALLEELKGMPFGVIWNYYCLQSDVPIGFSFMDDIRDYEKTELAKRS